MQLRNRRRLCRASWLTVALAVVAAPLLSAPAAAASGPQPAASHGEPSRGATQAGAGQTVVPQDVTELSLSQAIELALASSEEVQLAELAVDRDRLGLREAQEAASDARDAEDEPCQRVGTLNTCAPEYKFQLDVAEEVGPDRALDALTVSEKNVDAVKRRVRAEAEKAYYAALLANETLGLRREAAEIAREQLRLARVGFETGARSKSEVLAAEVDLAEAEAAVKTAEKNLELALSELSQMLGLPRGTRIRVTDTLTPGELPGLALDEAVQKALQNNLSLFWLERMVMYQQEIADIAARYMPNTFRHRSEVHQVKELQVQLEDARERVDLLMRQAYLTMVDTHNQIAQYDKAIEAAEENLRLQQLRYEAGLSTSLEVHAASAQLTGVRLQRLQAIYLYRTSQSTFELLLHGAPLAQEALSPTASQIHSADGA